MSVAQFHTPKGHAVQMSYRPDTNDWNTLRSCLDEDEYGLRGRSLSGYALDLGAHIGGASVALAKDNPELHVIAVEPVPDNVALLRENVAQNGLEGRVTVIEGAIGSKDAVTVWYGYRGSETAEHHAWIGNSTLAYSASTESHDEVTYAEPYSVARLLEMAGGTVALAKIDTEGAEYDFLSGDLRGIETIVGEVHPVERHRIAELRPLLDATHELTFSGANVEAGPCNFEAVRR